MKVTQKIWKLMRSQGWEEMEYDDAFRSRVSRAFRDWNKWYQWSMPVEWIAGRNVGGTPDPPRGRDLWWIPIEYVERPEHLSWLADFEQKFNCYITWNYGDVRKSKDLDWRVFDLQDDGHTVKIGQWPNLPEHKGRIAPLPWAELNRDQVNLFLWWYLVKHKGQAQWFGIRSWVWGKALHASVHEKVPFACQAVPAPGSGGYDHWYCQLKKRHEGPHRFRNYTWEKEVEYSPR